MEEAVSTQIEKNQNFNILIQKRAKITRFFLILVVGVYALFIIFLAFFPPILATPFKNSTITIGIPFGLFVIFFSIVLTGFYLYIASKEFDPLVERIKKDLKGKV